MAENNICEFQKEHIEAIAGLQTDMENVKEKVSSLSNIEKSIERMTTLMEYQTKENEKRDKLMEQQSKTLTQQSLTLSKVNDNLDSLNVEVKTTNARIDRLETKFQSENAKNLIDIREINKDKVKLSLKDKVKKNAIPLAAITALVVAIVDALKGLKIFGE